MALLSAYSSPGVSVTEATSPTIAAVLAAPNAIAIVGDAQGYQSAVEASVITSGDPYTLINTGVVSGTLSVYNVSISGTLMAVNTDYTITVDPKNTSIDGDETTTITLVGGGQIVSGNTISVTYEYVNQNYYEPTVFNNFSDVTDKYGEAFATDGTIGSKLSFAIRMALTNGATEVIGVARKAGDVNFVSALAKLLDIDQIAFVSVVSGDSGDHSAVVAHCTTAATTYGLNRQCVLGYDSSSVAVVKAALRTTAEAYNNQNVILISPSSFNITNPVSLTPYAIGAQYAASAVLGMFAARDATVPLTRKTVAGFVSPNETRTVSDASADSSAGLFVIEYKGNIFRVRHGITTAVTDVNKREASVVRAKYVLAYELKKSLDGLIGTIASISQAPLIVAGQVDSLLSQLVLGGLIGSYQNLNTRLLNNPTTVEVRFEYAPLYPINNINVVFTINTANGGFQLTQL